MKYIVKILSVVMLLVLMSSMFTLVASAKDLELCYHCNGTGSYHCKTCGNKGSVTCDGCKGKGKWACKDCNGSGYLTCKSCHGDGLIRNGDGEIPPDAKPGSCGNCGGSGKVRCITCHAKKGWIVCNRCDGSGKRECQIGDCKKSKAIGWKCSYCKGAGYLLTNFWPGENDGVQNRPVNGDKIWSNGKSTTYGKGNGSGESKNKTTESKTTESKTTENKTTQNKTTENKTIENKNNNSVTTTENQNQTTENPSQITEPTTAPSTVVLPDNRNTDFDIQITAKEGEVPKASAKIEMGRMSDAQQRYYAELTEEKLSEILGNVQNIVSSAEPGRMDGDTEALLEKLAEKNGFESVEQGRLLPIYFEGHQDIGFPIMVSVKLEKGVLDGGNDLFVYHQLENGDIVSLGKAEYHTYDDGSVEEISFYTDGFSSFFTSSKEIDTDVSNDDAEVDESVKTIGSLKSENSLTTIIVIAVCTLALVAVIVAVILIIKKKRRA